jgi:hypothetical protein
MFALVTVPLGSLNSQWNFHSNSVPLSLEYCQIECLGIWYPSSEYTSDGT